MAALLFCVGFREVPWFARAGFAQYAVSWGGAIAAAFIGTWAGYKLVTRTPTLVERVAVSNPWPWMALAFDRASIVKAAVFILVFWIPFIVLQYPCAMNGDTYNQLYQFQTSYPTLYTTMGITVPESFIDHHPVFDTLIFGFFLSLGEVLGSQNAGLFIYSLFQNVLAALGLGLACCYMKRLGVPKVFRLVSLVFCAVFFLYPLWASTMVKDSLHAVFFLYFFLCYVEVFRTRGQAMQHTGFVLAFAAAALMAALTKKPGFYIVCVSLAVLAVYCLRGSGFKRLVAVCAVVPVVQLVLLPLAVYPAIGGVAAGGSQESFGFALQQVATVLIYEDDLSAEERAAVEGVLDIERALDRYTPASVDPVKNSAQVDASRANYMRFVGAYLSIGIRHIPAYTYSVFATVAALVCPGVELTFNHTLTQEESWVNKFQQADTKGELALGFSKPEALEEASVGFMNAYESFASLPGPNFVFGKGMYGGWIPVICACLALYAGRRYLVAYTPIIASVAFVLLSPVTSSRYVVPLMFVTVLSLALLCYALTQGRHLNSTNKA